MTTQRRTDLFDVFLGSDIGRLYHVSGELHVAMDNQRFVGTIRVDADFAQVDDRIGSLTLLPKDFHVGVKLTRVGSLRKMHEENV